MRQESEVRPQGVLQPVNDTELLRDAARTFTAGGVHVLRDALLERKVGSPELQEFFELAGVMEEVGGHPPFEVTFRYERLKWLCFPKWAAAIDQGEGDDEPVLGFPAYFDAKRGLPEAQRCVMSLDCRMLDEQQTEVVLGSDYAPHLLRLGLFDDRSSPMILRSARLSSLESVRMPLTYAFVEALAACPRLPALKSLVVDFNLADPSVLAALARLPMPSLRALTITSHSEHVLPMGVLATLRAKLRSLTLEGVGLSPMHVRSLSGGALWSSLEQLDLSGAGLTPTALSTIFRSTPELRRLRLVEQQSPFPSYFERALETTRLPALTELRFEGLQLTDEGAAALASSELGKVTLLSLKSCGLSSRGLAALCANQSLTALRHLGIDGNFVNDAGARALARSPLASQLVALEVRDNRMTEAGLGDLFSAPMPRLRAVRASGPTDSLWAARLYANPSLTELEDCDVVDASAWARSVVPLYAVE